MLRPENVEDVDESLRERIERFGAARLDVHAINDRDV